MTGDTDANGETIGRHPQNGRRNNMNRKTMKMNLQNFAEPGGEIGGAQPPEGDQGGQTGETQPPAIDYDKIQQMLNGTLAAKEETALKAYFKQQGLSQQEAEQAMADFKTQKAKNQPDVGALQQQAAAAQKAALEAQIQSTATMAAVSLSIDAKTIPYVLKMADLSKVAGEDGKINEETLKASLNKVLEDIPALKPQQAGTGGFVQVGAGAGNSGATATDAELDRIFGVKK